MSKRSNIYLLGIIVLLGAVLRFIFLGEAPLGFHRDEAFFGYNAFSLLLTGKELTGHFLPLHLTSFLHSPALYSYIAIPFISMFGLTEFSTRLPAAVFGVATIPLVYFLSYQLFHSYKQREELSLLSAFLLAISPWHINLSRVATENVIVVFLITLGVLFYLFSITRKTLLYLLLTFFSFFLALITYQAPRAFLPLIIPVLFLLSFTRTDKRHKILTLVLFSLLIVIPVILIILSPTLSERLRMLSIFHHPETQLVLNEQLREDGVAGVSSLFARLFHNKLINYASLFISNYIQHFSFDFFFTDAALPVRYKVPMMGLLHIVEGITLLFGIITSILKPSKSKVLLLLWFFLAPVGSALTFDDTPNLQRTLLIFPALSILAGLGFVEIIQRINNFHKPLLSRLSYVIFIFLTLFSLSYYLHQYYIHEKFHQPWNRNEGYKELMSEVIKRKDHYDKVIITEWQSDPYIFYLFYSRYNPVNIQNIYISKGSKYKKMIDNLEFSSEDCPLKVEAQEDKSGAIVDVVKGKEGILYINSGACSVPKSNVKVIRTIRRSDNSAVFTILEYTKNT